MPLALSAHHLSKRYPKAPEGVQALSDVDLDIPTGVTHGLIGRNGAGKTTFVRIAATQLAPTSGSIAVFGHDVLTDPRSVRARIACIPQESRPLYFLKVEEVVFLYLKMRGLEPSDARRRTRGVLAELELTEQRHELVSHLSGGLRRRALVAMVFASDAELLFLDEPTTGLDPLARRQVWDAIRHANRDRRTVVLTTHYLDEAEALSARLALIERGKVLLSGTPEELRARLPYPYRVTISGSVPTEMLQPYGRVTPIEGGHLVLAKEADARDLARWGLEHGHRLSLGPVSLEDLFLEVVGRPLTESDGEVET
ncbi:MAG: ATP-binding cassette domain-containing protein [Thermoplasmata archaeon]